jgi:YHS domain-containing protein
MMNNIKWIFSSTIILLFFGTSLIYAAEPVSKSYFGSKAIDGYDTVAYHNPEAIAQHIATKGSSDFVVEWKGAKWHFVDPESAQKFHKNPGQYSPAYNGHCANALSLGKGLVKTDGSHWEILEKQLYLFYNAGGRDRWLNGDWKAFKKVADKAWLEIINK